MGENLIQDKEDMNKILLSIPDMIKKASKLAEGLFIKQEIKNICVAGMGGSGFSGDLLKAFMSSTAIPVFVNKSYGLPNYITNEFKTQAFFQIYCVNIRFYDKILL